MMPSRILILPYTHTLSHLSRPLLIAEELRSRGLEVVFAGESPKTAFIRQEGLDVVPIFEPDPNTLFDNIRRGRLRFASEKVIKKMIETDLSIYEEIRPEIGLLPPEVRLARLREVNPVDTGRTCCTTTPL